LPEARAFEDAAVFHYNPFSWRPLLMGAKSSPGEAGQARATRGWADQAAWAAASGSHMRNVAP
jgi:hypothetical protein